MGALNSEPIDWTAINLTFVSSAEVFEEDLSRQIQSAQVIDLEQLKALKYGDEPSSPRLVVKYQEASWPRYAKPFGLMEDVKDHVHRGAYRGVLPFTWKQHRVFLVADWPLR